MITQILDQQSVTPDNPAGNFVHFRPLGQILLDHGAIREEALDEALAAQNTSGNALGRSLIANGACSEAQVLKALGEQLDIQFIESIPDLNVEPEAVQIFPAQLALKRQVMPLSLKSGAVELAIADPFRFDVIDEAAFVTGRPIRPVLAPESEIRRLTERFYMQQALREKSGAEEVELISDDISEAGDLQRMAGDAVVVQWVNLLLREAVRDRASDIHIEPFEHGIRVRNRIDGILHEASPPPGRLQAAIVSRIKIMASMDIAERRVPLDGRIKLRAGGQVVDIRVSTMPTVFGESVALRILDRSSVIHGLEELGMFPNDLELMERLLAIPHGILLVTGPTGSGKTTTLYAALRKTSATEKKVITIEDPVEYQLDGINQIQVRPKVGLTFASGLRHIVRQDPDVIMVGEIRDAETAEVAIHAALTGHLVFSTLHTNDSAGAIVRLIEMGIEPFLISSSVEAVLAQRLVRKLCTNCSRPDLSRTGSDRKVAAGCDECRHTGYRGRTAIFEILAIDDELRTLIASRASAGELMELAVRKGARTLLQDGMLKVDAGVTTLEEVMRVTRCEELREHKLAAGSGCVN
jgi:type II secretion system protein E